MRETRNALINEIVRSSRFEVEDPPNPEVHLVEYGKQRRRSANVCFSDVFLIVADSEEEKTMHAKWTSITRLAGRGYNDLVRRRWSPLHACTIGDRLPHGRVSTILLRQFPQLQIRTTSGCRMASRGQRLSKMRTERRWRRQTAVNGASGVNVGGARAKRLINLDPVAAAVIDEWWAREGKKWGPKIW